MKSEEDVVVRLAAMRGAEDALRRAAYNGTADVLEGHAEVLEWVLGVPRD